MPVGAGSLSIPRLFVLCALFFGGIWMFFSGRFLPNPLPLTSSDCCESRKECEKQIEKLRNEIKGVIAHNSDVFKKKLREKNQIIAELKHQLLETEERCKKNTDSEAEERTQSDVQSNGKEEKSDRTEKKIELNPKTDTEDSNERQFSTVDEEEVIPVVVLAHARANYLERALKSLFRFLPPSGYTVYVSQDGGNPDVEKVARKFHKVKHIQHAPLTSFPALGPNENPVYYRIADHYGWAIKTIFAEDPKYQHLILLEEDLEISPDFFDYFRAVIPIIDSDPQTYYCASAFNDNGQPANIFDYERLHLSDFFPGLGWMLPRWLWEDLGTWPLGYWDDWLREPTQRKGRVCIRPEVSRSKTFGQEGASGGQFYHLLQSIVLNDKYINWKKKDLSYLKKSSYATTQEELIADAKLIQLHELTTIHGMDMDVKIEYQNFQHFSQIATMLGIMSDEKAGVPRTAFNGVVTLQRGKYNVFIVPSPGVKLYEF